MTSLTFRPMLACSTIPELDQITYPVIASPKLDGIRCIMADGKAWSRKMKQIPNKHIQRVLGELNLHGFDGELLVKGDFNSVQSAVMSVEGEPDFEYHVFDYWDSSGTFMERSKRAWKELHKIDSSIVRIVPQRICHGPVELATYWKDWVSEGYEGAIVRDAHSPYKQGRSTLIQGWMLKLKHHCDDEAVIVGFTELMHNCNDADIGELGQTTRSKHQDNLVPGNKLGAFLVSYNGHNFNIGTGFTDEQRRDIWQSRASYLGKLVTFRYQELSKYGIPRFPVFKGVRNQDDV